MANPKPTKKRKATKLKPNKIALFLKAYLDESNPTTFLNKTESAIKAKYKCKTRASFQAMGYKTFLKVQPTVAKWLLDNKFSQSALRSKHSELLETHKTIFHKVKGRVNGTLPEGVRIVAETSRMMIDGEDTYDDGETILALNVADPEIQRKALDMAYKITGEYAPEKREHGGIGGGAIPLTAFPPEPKTMDDWIAMREKEEQKLIKAD